MQNCTLVNVSAYEYTKLHWSSVSSITALEDFEKRTLRMWSEVIFICQQIHVLRSVGYRVICHLLLVMTSANRRQLGSLCFKGIVYKN